MPFNPEDYIGEVLGRPAVRGFDPSASGFVCPFLGTKCTKSGKLSSEPYPVCSVRRNDVRICVCPKRFHQVDFLKDVIKHCWSSKLPLSPKIAREVTMTGFGTVDYVIADVGEDSTISEFLSVELQAVDTTGTVSDAYQALRSGEQMDGKVPYGINWGNVYKRYVTQLIRKGYFHHHWKSKIVAVMQDVVYQYVCDWADFMRSPEVKNDSVNIIFMSYKFEDDLNNPGRQCFVLDKVEGTSHSSLQQAVLYKESPGRDEFCARILKALQR